MNSPRILAIGLLAALSCFAGGSFYVSPNGTQTSGCTNQGGPYCSLEGAKALARGNAPATIFLKGGTYYLPFLLSSTGGTLTFAAADSGNSTADTITWRNVSPARLRLSDVQPVAIGCQAHELGSAEGDAGGCQRHGVGESAVWGCRR